MPRVIALFGPTASGKTAAAVELASRRGGEVVNCDAMQLYAGLPILTNQPDREQLAAIPHHLVGVWPLSHEGSVAEYAELAAAAITAVLERGRDAVVCGGSGLYLRAALAPIDLPPQPDAGVRERYQSLYDEVGGERAHALLGDRDPAAAARVHPNDRRRVVRALELADAGRTLAPAEPQLWAAPAPETLVLGLHVPPEVVRERIAARTRAMFERGVEGEVRTALAAGPISHTAARIHGLDDLSALLRGDIDRDEAIRRLDIRTRQYAKRQRVWMRRLPGLRLVSGVDELLEAAAA
jgi:tRNA dimethylallyltransferase